jgi:hypothetical protein
MGVDLNTGSAPQFPASSRWSVDLGDHGVDRALGRMDSRAANGSAPTLSPKSARMIWLSRQTISWSGDICEPQRRRDRGLLGEIERGALDERTPIGAVLRKCVILSGRAGSEELRGWATRELRGYGPDDELPGYRMIPAAIKVDFVNLRFRVTGQRISPHSLPEVVREHVDETLPMRMGIGEVEALARLRKTTKISASPCQAAPTSPT